MGQALYRKYRSKSLKEIVGQEQITKTLDRALKSGRISHAYLFTGPHGVGKTSIARILAHEVNGLPYDDDSSHIDIIEIDAASNRRIDEIRELREKVYTAPTSAKYKVYIIDEVHMLTREAFNALLKTLEEPPSHVIFILATTDAHKLPETIISRTQRFTFKPVESSKVIEHLKYIAEQENIEVSDEALALLAKHGQGSFRDSISLLDQASARGHKLAAADILALLGIPPDESVTKLLSAVAERSGPSQIFQALLELYGQGYQPAAIAKQLGLRLRQQLLSGSMQLSSDLTLKLLRELIDVPVAGDPERLLEIILLEAAHSDDNARTIEANNSKSTVSKQSSSTTTHQVKKLDTERPKESSSKLDEPSTVNSDPIDNETAHEPSRPASKTSGGIDASDWPDILAALKKRHNTLYGIARMAQPDFSEDGILKLYFNFPFHQKRLNEAKNRQILTEIIQQSTGHQVSVECLVDKNASPPQTDLKDQKTNIDTSPKSDLVTISNIFGGGELLES